MGSDLFKTGVRPYIDAFLLEKSKEVRSYGDYWSASSAGYCMRKLIFERLGVPPVKPHDARKTRVFEVGHVFHEYMQRITKEAGISIAQEVELQDDTLMVRGHFDDLVLLGGKLILYDYKTCNSRAFTWAKANGNAMSHYHRMQLSTYMYMLRKDPYFPWAGKKELSSRPEWLKLSDLTEARILKISKDDMRMEEQQLLWSPALEKEVVEYWSTLNGYWKSRKIPKCTCDKYEGGFMSREAFNPFYFEGEPCSLKWLAVNKDKLKEMK